MINTSRKCYEN